MPKPKITITGSDGKPVESPKYEGPLKILAPHRLHSARCPDFQAIKADVNEMHKLMAGMPMELKGLSLHHAQVSNAPYNFFVIAPYMRQYFNGYHMIANPRYKKRDERRAFQEVCMSYPHRPPKNTVRFYRITIECEVEHDLGGRFRTTELELQGIAAYMVQHETDHARGIYIYDESASQQKPKKKKN